MATGSNRNHILLAAALLCAGCSHTRQATTKPSAECQSCHPAFYKRWSASKHGLAMQPFTPLLARTSFQPHAAPLRIGEDSFQAKLDGEQPYVEQVTPNGKRKLPIAHAMGGKNTYYLLTPMERGRLQVLPLAYDVQSNNWYAMAASGVRIHGPASQSPLAWTDPAFTFNTSCYGCHASQLQTNYTTSTDSYNTTWREPGINCESCHGDASAHLKNPADPGILQISVMNATQRTAICAPCHAKMSPLSASYQPAQRFFDHYDLTTLESADFYPDGRDLGENYTYTSWLLGSCNRNNKLDCLNCHTSTGASRFTAENSDQACTSCHQEIAARAEKHTHHESGTAGARCIGCHMPKTRFANMTRSDHSFLPPTPAATMQFQSPNACNICHSTKDAAWADSQVRKWYKPGYQQPALDRARLIDDARHQQWKLAPAMLSALRDPKSNPVFSTSLLRLLRSWNDPRKVPILVAQLNATSPLVRAAAAASLASSNSASEVLQPLFKATEDDYRLVRIRAAAALASGQSPPKAVQELEDSFNARPDDYTSQTNLANFYLRRGDVARSLESFQRAISLRPDSVGTLVNASVAYSRAGRPADAERVLRQAAHYAPQNPAVLFNLGLLFAELKRTAEAEAALRAAFEADPTLAPAAYNLAILVSAKDRKQAISLCRKAVAISPEPRYVKALAQFLAKDGQIAEAKRIFDQLKP